VKKAQETLKKGKETIQNRKKLIKNPKKKPSRNFFTAISEPLT
jgi:hypothetical protein